MLLQEVLDELCDDESMQEYLLPVDKKGLSRRSHSHGRTFVKDEEDCDDPMHFSYIVPGTVPFRWESEPGKPRTPQPKHEPFMMPPNPPPIMQALAKARRSRSRSPSPHRFAKPKVKNIVRNDGYGGGSVRGIDRELSIDSYYNNNSNNNNAKNADRESDRAVDRVSSFNNGRQEPSGRSMMAEADDRFVVGLKRNEIDLTSSELRFENFIKAVVSTPAISSGSIPILPDRHSSTISISAEEKQIVCKSEEASSKVVEAKLKPISSQGRSMEIVGTGRQEVRPAVVVSGPALLANCLLSMISLSDSTPSTDQITDNAQPSEQAMQALQALEERRITAAIAGKTNNNNINNDKKKHNSKNKKEIGADSQSGGNIKNHSLRQYSHRRSCSCHSGLRFPKVSSMIKRSISSSSSCLSFEYVNEEDDKGDIDLVEGNTLDDNSPSLNMAMPAVAEEAITSPQLPMSPKLSRWELGRKSSGRVPHEFLHGDCFYFYDDEDDKACLSGSSRFKPLSSTFLFDSSISEALLRALPESDDFSQSVASQLNQMNATEVHPWLQSQTSCGKDIINHATDLDLLYSPPPKPKYCHGYRAPSRRTSCSQEDDEECEDKVVDKCVVVMVSAKEAEAEKKKKRANNGVLSRLVRMDSLELHRRY